MSRTAPTFAWALDDSLAVTDLNNIGVGGTCTTAHPSSNLVFTWASGTPTDIPVAVGVINSLELALTDYQCRDFEMCCTLAWNSCAPGFVARYTDSGDQSALLVRPVDLTNPLGVWGLYQMSDNSPEKTVFLADFQPANIGSASTLDIRWAAVGAIHRIKIWDSSQAEPSWNVFGNVLYTQQGVYSTSVGKLGPAMFGGNSGSDTVTMTNLQVAPYNKVVSPLVSSMFGGIVYDNVDRNSYTCTFSCKKNSVLLISVFNTKSTTPDTPLTPSATNLTVAAVSGAASTTYNTTASPTTRSTFYTAKASADITAGTLTVGFSGVTQNGCIIEVMVLCGADNSASDGSSAVLNGAIDAPNSNSTSVSHTQTYTKAAGLSGCAAQVAHNANEATVVGSGFIAPAATVNAGSPAHSGIMEYQNAQDTSVDATWSTSSRRCINTAEVVYLDPTTIYPAILSFPTATFRRRRMMQPLLVR